ncbi:histidine kinase [Methanocella sp. CWC-04]|uniref:Histidine kinase n=1 Tax=Methanooceanicella nereidis TaxID=2052831 RepID=A0AAP2RDF9_9EURY|nr:CBS domain-containing protein [Methanocella sp. CWC-04]MCD1295488.1 histidine kinase [Methanocella sp. CWC-04]
MKIEEVMTKEVVTCSPSDSIEKVIKLMGEQNVSGLPVVEEGKVVGIITEGDILKLLSVPEHSSTLWLPSPLEVILEIPFRDLMQLRELQKSYNDIGEKPISNIMSRNVRSISPDKDIEDAASLMMRYNINRLPVVKDGKLVGIVAREDIIHGLGGTVEE